MSLALIFQYCPLRVIDLFISYCFDSIRISINAHSLFMLIDLIDSILSAEFHLIFSPVFSYRLISSHNGLGNNRGSFIVPQNQLIISWYIFLLWFLN
jgi:hypothetical protein